MAYVHSNVGGVSTAFALLSERVRFFRVITDLCHCSSIVEYHDENMASKAARTVNNSRLDSHWIWVQKGLEPFQAMNTSVAHVRFVLLLLSNPFSLIVPR